MTDYDELLSRILADADSHADRCLALADLVDDVPPAKITQIVGHLSSVSIEEWTDEERRQIWQALRGASARHLRFADAPWAMPTELAEQIVAVAVRFEPRAILDRVLHLFSAHVELPESPSLDWRQAEQSVSQKRADAVAAIYEAGAAPALRRLVLAADAPWTVGVAVVDARLGALVAIADDWLNGNDHRLVAAARSLFRRLADPGGRDAAIGLLSQPPADQWPAEWRAFVYGALDFGPATWDAVSREGPDVSNAYWTTVPIYGRGELAADVVDAALDQFVRAGALAQAIAFAGLYANQGTPARIVDLLNAASEPSPAPEAPLPWDHLGNDVLRLLELLQQSDVDHSTVARLEWLFAPLVHIGRFRPEALFDALARDPSFFIEVLALAFRAEDEPQRTPGDASERALARRSFQLLSTWDVPPGSMRNEIDAAALNSWVDEARRQAAAVRRLAIADIHIGEVLANTPVDPDGAWPPVAVRDLVERLKSDELDRGIHIGVSNGRGVTTRALGAGGDLERELAERYRTYSDAVRDRWPRTAALLMSIMKGLEREARREDNDAFLERREAGMDDAP